MPKVLAVFVLALAPLWAAGARAAPDRQAELRQAHAELARIAREVERRGAAHDAARAALAQADRELAAAGRELAAAEAALAREEAALRELAGRVAEHETRLARERRALAATVRARYETPQGGALALLLGASDPARTARLIAWQRYLAQAQGERTRTLADALAQLAAERTRLAQRRDRAEAARAAQRSAAAELARARAARETALTQAAAALAEARARERVRRADAERLQALLERVERARTDSPRLGRALAPPRFVDSEAPFASRRGELPWPAPGRIAARFGQARESGHTRWQGTLIATAPGTPVRAVHGGRVVYADALRGFGLLVIVDHGGGYMSLYGYNAAVHRAAGDTVRPGEVLAEVGSGLTSPDGLYFEIRAAGRPVDPAEWCRG